MPKNKKVKIERKGINKTLIPKEEVQTDHLNMLFSFKYFDYEWDYSFKHISNDKNRVERLLKHLVEFSSCTWNEFKQNKKHHHTCKLEKFTKKARDRFEYRNYQDVNDDELFSLSLCNKERIYGIRTGRILNVIWYDKNHELYKSNKN